MHFNRVSWCFNRAVHKQHSHDSKIKLGAVGFEPTPPKRLVPKTSALDHSATLPDARNIGSKHCKSIGAYYLSVLKGSRNQVVDRLIGLK